jgi:CheY-like chemotaxis protein
VTVDTLEYAGYRALGVASGELALAAIHDAPFLVVAALRMPRMDGSQLLNAMRAELGEWHPVVFVTGALTSMKGHIDAPVLSKPVDVDELLNMVARHCSDRKSGDHDHD